MVALCGIYEQALQWVYLKHFHSLLLSRQRQRMRSRRGNAKQRRASLQRQ